MKLNINTNTNTNFKVKESYNNTGMVDLTDHEIKLLIIDNIISQIKDTAAQNALRQILFSKDNKINWQSAYTILKTCMPELDNI